MTAEPPRTTWHVAQYRPLALASQRDASASPPANENAALRGASLAFTKSSPAPKPRINTYSGTDGALAAATKAGGGSQGQLEPGVASSSNKALLIGSNNNRGSAGPGNGPLLAAQQSVVRERARDMTDPIPSQGTGKVGHVASASSIAAMAAVASSVRNSSPSDVQNRQKPEPLRPRQITGHMLATDRNTGTEGFDLNPEQSSQGNNSARPTSRSPARNQQPDQTSIAPTASLIGLFEGDGDPRRATQGLGDRPIVSNSPAPVIKSPKPMRPIPRNAPENAALAAARRLATPEGAVVKRSLSKADATPDTDKGRIFNNRGPDTGAPNLAQVSDRLALEAARRSSPPKSPPTSLTEPPQPPPARKKRPPRPEGGNIKAEAVGKAASPPRQPSPYRPAVNGRPAPRDSLVQRSSEDSNMETRTLARDSLDSTRSRPHSMSQFPSNSSLWLEDRPAGFNEGHRWPQPHHRGKIYPHMTGDSLADAIVASSLASSRAPSPSKSPAPPLPLPRRHGKGHQWFHQQQEDPRTPSPAKGMRQTMRKPKAEEDDDSATGPKARRNLIKKHPHKHHEGDRKRWRDQVTERERKRYEGVWAANKGAFTTHPLTPPAPSKPQRPVEPSFLVCNILVRDVWSRSRLGPDVLEEVWELVDRTATGCLDREEFVVGIWLIDQRLKGRKLPIKVSSSVWDSVRSMGGIKVHGRR